MRYLFILFALWTSNSVTASAATLNGLPPIRIGVSNVQSGASKSLGQQLIRGSDAYFAFVNNSGGIYGRKVEVILKDDRYEPDPAVENTNDLMTKDKVFFLFDYVGTPTLTRVLPLLESWAAMLADCERACDREIYTMSLWGNLNGLLEPDPCAACTRTSLRPRIVPISRPASANCQVKRSG